MVTREFKIFLISFFFFMLIILSSHSVYAGLAGGARSEGGHSPAQSSSDSPSGSTGTPTTTTTGTQEEVEMIPHYIYIEGNVYEDLGYDSETLKIEKTNIHGVKVSAVNGQGDAVCETITDKNGYYILKPPPGCYDLKFTYGDVNNINHSSPNANDLTVSDVLYYNGHDYVVSKIPTGQYSGGCSTISTEIIQGGKGVSQVMLLIDASYSMRHTNVVVNGETMTRFDNSLNSTKKLINDLLEDSDNIYIGIVVFAGNNWRAAGLSKDQQFLYDVIEDLKTKGDQFFEEYTNISGAFKKAMDSFYIDEDDPDYKDHSNRNIVLISDGIPTSDGYYKTYSDYSDDQILNVLYNHIGPNTKKKVEEALNDGINVMTLISRSDDQEERDFVDGIYKDIVTNYKEVKDETELSIAIRNSIEEFITSITSSSSSSEGEKIIITGYEDAQRREDVDKRYRETPFYLDVRPSNVEEEKIEAVFDMFQGPEGAKVTFGIDNIGTSSLAIRTILFKAINNTTRDITERSEALSEGTWMSATAGSYEIDSPQESTTVVTYIDADGITHKKTIIHYNTGYTEQDMALSRRQDFTLRVETTATAYRCILNTGEVLTDYRTKMSDTTPILEWLDDDLAHGATIQIEYTINVYNDSSVPCTYLELIDYLPAGFVFNADSDMLTVGIKNSESGWENLDLDKSKLAGLTLFDSSKINNNCIRLKKGGDDSFIIQPGNEPFQTKILVSRVIGTMDDVKGPIDDQSVEVLAYKNSSDRRMVFNNNDGTTPLTKKLGVYPGSAQSVQLGSGVDFNWTTNNVIVSPPTGMLSSKTFKSSLFSFINRLTYAKRRI